MGARMKLEIVSSAALKHPSVPHHRSTRDWLSHDIPSDLTVIALHKFPLVSHCGWIRRVTSEAKEADLSTIELADFPGGAQTFELIAKFCYGITPEVDVRNVAALRCAAEYLDMDEQYAPRNLCAQADTFIKKAVLNNLDNCVVVLQECEILLPLADEIGIIQDCVQAIAVKACWEQRTPNLSLSDLRSCEKMDSMNSPGLISTQTSIRKFLEWWVEEISVLRIDTFQRVLAATKAHGMCSDIMVIAIAHYAQRWLRVFFRKPALGDPSPVKLKVNDPNEHQQRILVETLVSLMPMEKYVMPVSFLCAMLRVAIHLDTTVACRLELEKRIGWQLEEATVDALLIPSYNSQSGDTFYDLDTVSRIVTIFLQRGREEEHDFCALHDCECLITDPSHSAVMKSACLLDSYLAEVAPDASLSVLKFVTFAGLMPECSRVVDDGLYRAIDIYLKAHPGISDLERKKVCSLMNCQKLSQEACAHAAQNERLPIQVVVQVLFYEQARLRNAMSAAGDIKAAHKEEKLPQMEMGLVPLDHFAMMQRENEDLKMELARMKSKLGDNDQEQQLMTKSERAATLKESGEKSKSRLSKILGKLNPFHRISSNDNALKTVQTPDVQTRKLRRHSMS